MFWDKGYAPSPNIEALLQKENVKVEELLDDEDILQECKTQKRSLIQYLTRPDIIKRLVELTITEPPENLPIAQRFKYANMACEVLTFGLPSLDQKLVEDPDILQTLYSFLEQEPPLNPLLSSFFSKTFSMLISKKSEQDWFLYQKMCLQVLEFIKSRRNFLDLIFRHFATPVIMDLLLQIMREVQGNELKKNFYEWLKEQKLVQRLINLLGQPEESEKHNNIAEFLTDLIKNGRSMRQKDQDNDSFELAFIGSDPLLQVIEDESCVSQLLDVILSNEARESSIASGINIVLTLVDESIVDEPASDKALKMIIDKEKESHEKVVSTVIRVIAPKLKDFHHLLLNPPNKTNIFTTITQVSPPFGLTRLQICRLFTVLLKTGNKDVIEKICETDFFNTLLKLFKQYSWNNFLHSEVEKCLEYVFATFDQNENKNGFGLNPSALQTFVIVNCKIVSKLIDAWMHNRDVQSSKNGHRLGYMGHLIQIFKHITSCISNSDHIGALIVSNLNEQELENWKLITDQETGELTVELGTQNKMLANCNAHESSDCNISLPREFHNENICSKIFSEFESNLRDPINDQNSLRNQIGLNVISCFMPSDGMGLNLDLDFKVWESSIYNETQPLNISIDAWGADPFSGQSMNNSNDTSGWADFSNNFADFDAHFKSFSSDLGYNTSSNPSQNNSEALSGFKSNNNNGIGKINIEKTVIQEDDDNDDEDDINFKNVKNLDMKTDEDDNDEENNGYMNDTIEEKEESVENTKIFEDLDKVLNDTDEQRCQNYVNNEYYEEADFTKKQESIQITDIKNTDKDTAKEDNGNEGEESKLNYTINGPVTDDSSNKEGSKINDSELDKQQIIKEIIEDDKKIDKIQEDSPDKLDIVVMNNDLPNNSIIENSSNSVDTPVAQENGPV